MPGTPSAVRLPNADAERVLTALARWAADVDRPLIVLCGPAKAGKTVLLDVFAARSEPSFSVIYLSNLGPDPDALSTRILAALGETPSGTPRLALARALQRPASRPLLLLLDDADTLSPRVEMWLFDLARRSAGGLRVVLALSDPRLAREFALAFRTDTELLSLGADMDRTEADAYLQLVALRASESPRGAGGRGFAPAARERPSPAPDSLDAPPLLSAAALPREPAPPSAATRAAAPVAGAVRKQPRRRGIAVAAGLALSFVAGFAISQLLDARRPAGLEPPPVETRALRAELPPVSAAPPLRPSDRSAGAAPDAVERAASDETGVPDPADSASPAAELAPVAPSPLSGPTAPVDVMPSSRPPDDAPEPLVPAAALDGGPAARAADPAAGSTTAEPGADRSHDEAAEPPESATASAAEPETTPARPRTVAVQIRAEPGAVIELGGRSLGAAPVGAVDLPPGAHRLLVRLVDGREIERVVEVRGRRYEIQIR
ncbi:AAA family ATPase [Myxococcota bacterium]|nr:AAA family ATPase [Myxococcota bacterium]